MYNTSDLNNISCLDLEWQSFSAEDLENDPCLKPGGANKDDDASDAALYREINKTPNLLDDSVEYSTNMSVVKSPPLSTVNSTSAKKVQGDLKKSLSFPPSATKSVVTVALDPLPKTPRATPQDNSITPLRRSQRASTQKKTQATEERLKQRSSSVASPKTNSDTAQFLSQNFGFPTTQRVFSNHKPYSLAMPQMSNDIQFLSPELESVMARSAISNTLPTSQLSETKIILSLLSEPLIFTPPDSIMSQSLVSYSKVPGLEEWNQLYLSRPHMGSQFAMWEWLDAVRSMAFRFPLSVVKYEESRLDIWTKGSTKSNTCDMSMSPADAFVTDVDGGNLTCNETDDVFLDLLMRHMSNEHETTRVSEKTKPYLAVENKEVTSPGAKSAYEMSDDFSPMRIAFPEAGTPATADDSRVKEVPPPAEYSAPVLGDKVVTFEERISPVMPKNKATISYRKTPHLKASQPTPRKTPSLNPHAPRYQPHTPFDKPHYPTTSYGFDSPSTDIPDSWIQLFLYRPDPFESSTKDVLVWLGEVSDMIESVNVKIPTISVSCMPSVSSMNDTPMTRKVNVRSPMFSPMMIDTPFRSPLNEESSDE